MCNNCNREKTDFLAKTALSAEFLFWPASLPDFFKESVKFA